MKSKFALKKESYEVSEVAPFSKYKVYNTVSKIEKKFKTRSTNLDQANRTSLPNTKYTREDYLLGEEVTIGYNTEFSNVWGLHDMRKYESHKPRNPARKTLSSTVDLEYYNVKKPSVKSNSEY